MKSSNIQNRVQILDRSEVRKLQKLVVGYGNLKDSAVMAGIHYNTLRNVIRQGYGKPEVIEKVREKLLMN